MAFKKAIPIQANGTTPTYWRVCGVYIDASTGQARIVLIGYVDADVRARNAQGGIDQREYALGPAQFAALAASPAKGESTFDTIAGACYEFVANARRPCELDQETGEGVLPSGERFDSKLVQMIGDVPTVPSEFADAANV